MVAVPAGLRRLFGFTRTLPPEAYALAGHFKAHGLDVEPRSLKPRKAGLAAVFELRIKEYPLPVVVLSCVDEPTAARFVEAGGDKASAFPNRNGRLVLYLPYWESEDSLTESVIGAFLSFSASGTERAQPKHEQDDGGAAARG